MKNNLKIYVSIKLSTTPVSCSNGMMLNQIVLLFDYTFKKLCIYTITYEVL